jgi:hypothetical protein
LISYAHSLLDTYQAGIPCQWIDITHYNTTDASITAPLSANMNPDHMLCEGQLYRNGQGDLIWERTNLTAVNGETVYKPKCMTGTSPSTLANNFDQVKITIPKDGHGYVTVCTGKSRKASLPVPKESPQ